MKIQWPTLSGEIASADIPYPICAYVEAIGIDAAAELFLKLGGAPIYLARNPRDASLLRSAIGEESIVKLSAALSPGHLGRIPIANRFLTRYLRSKGMSVQQIARTIRASDVIARRYLKPDRNWHEVTKDKSRFKRIFGDS